MKNGNYQFIPLQHKQIQQPNLFSIQLNICFSIIIIIVIFNCIDKNTIYSSIPSYTPTAAPNDEPPSHNHDIIIITNTITPTWF